MVTGIRNERYLKIRLAWAAAGIWALLLMTLSSCPATVTKDAVRQAAVLLGKFLTTLFSGKLSLTFQSNLTTLTAIAAAMFGYAVLALLLWYALRARGTRSRHAVILGFASSVLFAVIDELHVLIVPGRMPQLKFWLFDSIGALGAMLCVLLCRWLWVNCPRVFNRETISYVIFGVLTTLVNLITYGIFFNTLGVYNLVSNAIAWVAAVIFAYAVIKVFVFQSLSYTLQQTAREFGLFIAARLFSFAVDELGMWLLVDLLHANGGLSKIFMNIIVMIMNYFFSKWFIFTKALPSEQKE